MVTDKQIAQWRAACDKASPGPWVNDRCSSVETNDGIMIADFVPNVDDVDFIIISRDALPALLDEVERHGLFEEDGLVCPRCGKVFHDADINANPDEYWRCPYCFTWQHTACRGPISDDTEANALVREIERLREAIADLRRFFDDPVVVEHVAAWSHQSWSGWYKWMAAKWGQVHPSTGETFQERWKRQSETQYVLLSDSEQNSDRVEAKEILSELYKSLPWPRFKEEDGADQPFALDASKEPRP